MGTRGATDAGVILCFAGVQSYTVLAGGWDKADRQLGSPSTVSTPNPAISNPACHAHPKSPHLYLDRVLCGTEAGAQLELSSAIS